MPPDPADPRQKLIKLAEVPTAVTWLPTGRKGRPLTFFTLNRWAQYGLRGVKLRTVYVGDGMCTCENWLWEFFEALGTAPAPPTPPTPKQLTKARGRAAAMLDAAGV